MNIKKKLAKQKRKLIILVSVSLFALSIAMFTFFSIITYHNESFKLFNLAEANYYTYLVSTLNNVERKDLLNYFINLDHEDENTNIQVVIEDEKTGEIFAETKNALSFMDSKNNVVGCIDYNDFKASMTDEEYNKIVKYLTDNEAYKLYCIDYYSDDAQIIPKTIKVASEDMEFNETFNLNPKYSKSATYYKFKDVKDSIINREFVFGEYEKENLLEQIEGLPEYIFEDYNSPPFFVPEPFTIVCRHSEYYYIADKEYVVTYIEKFNILDNCIDDIMMTFIYIMILFAVAGIIIGEISWKTLKKQIEQENRLRTVTNAMAHELKTPLFIIGGYAENLAEDVNTDKRTHYAQVITEQINSMNEMVGKMLDYSKLDSESFTLNIERFELTALVKEICDNHNLDASQVDCESNIFIEADKRLIKNVVENLIENAVKYTTDFSKISVKLKDSTFSVQNPYKEVTKQEIEDMWKPYYRSTEQEKTKGHGLGLAIVKSVLDLHKFKHSTSYSDGNIIFGFEFK